MSDFVCDFCEDRDPDCWRCGGYMVFGAVRSVQKPEGIQVLDPQRTDGFALALNDHIHTPDGRCYKDRFGTCDAPKYRDGDQGLPSTNDEVDCQTRLMNRISQEVPARRQVGIQRYGTALQPFNGRDALRDLWEELLDASTYFMQVDAEYTALVKALRDVVESWSEARHMSTIREAERLLMRLGVYERQD